MKATRGTIMVVDDDEAMRSLLRDYFVGQGFEVRSHGSADAALSALGEVPADVVVSDIRMPGATGFEFAEAVQTTNPGMPVILITAFGSIESAIEAIRRGAYDYLVKPFKLAELQLKVDRALETLRLSRENQALRDEIKRPWGLDHMLGKSPAMRELFDLVTRVAQATANVLITGESGTGKEMVARAIHALGDRANRPFVAIDCTSIPGPLLESELFGHAKGSFTGAHQRKRGLFEEAEGGTIFLDEIGDMEVGLQAKLLRVLQERAIRPVGQNEYRSIDVRIIAATHKDLRAALRDGRFREDLYFRLSVIPVSIPPLRQRRDDIPLLVDAFLRKYSIANGGKVRGVTKDALKLLVGASWPGNVRELENVIERSVVLAKGALVDVSDLPDLDQRSPEEFFATAVQDFPTLDALEERYIKLVLEKTGGRKDRAAQILGVNRRTLYRKERIYGLAPDEGEEPGEDEDGDGPGGAPLPER
jgi:DNA-binding NtrC family response regulator